MKLAACGLMGALLLLSGAAAAQVYKCVDERGRAYYTDKPGPRCKGGPPPGAKAAPAGKAAAQKQAGAPPRQQAQAQDPLTRAQRCASMRRELERLAMSRRVAAVGLKGEVTYRDDPVRERRLAELEEEMRQCS